MMPPTAVPIAHGASPPRAAGRNDLRPGAAGQPSWRFNPYLGRVSINDSVAPLVDASLSSYFLAQFSGFTQDRLANRPKSLSLECTTALRSVACAAS